jgi:phosphatidylethanolamine/phosphatidyl-N-methylethanolamine N-methyltransferase
MLLQTSKFYNTFSGLYPIVDFFLSPQKHLLAKVVNELPKGNLLEIGVGNGSHIKCYKSHTLTGIDISSAMLAAARRRLKGNEILLLEMDGENLSFKDECFDYIVMSHVVAVTEHPEKLINEAHRVLKSKGKLIILNHFTPKNWLGYVDKLFEFCSKFFHFKSVFKSEDLPMKNFFLLKETVIGKLHYFKLLIYQKD